MLGVWELWGGCEMFEYTGSVWDSEGVALESGSGAAVHRTGPAGVLEV